MLPPTAAGSSSAVVIRSSTLIELDVERLAHMGAAVAQDLHHRVLVLDRIELRLHRLRLGHDLAERQRRREELDENHIHAGDYGHSVRGTQSLKTTAIIAIRSLQKDFFAGAAGGIAKGARIGRSDDDTAMNNPRHWGKQPWGQAPCFARPAAGPSGPALSAARPSPIPAPRRPGTKRPISSPAPIAAARPSPIAARVCASSPSRMRRARHRLAGNSPSKCPRCWSQASKASAGRLDSAQIAKNHTQPVAEAM